MTIIENFVIPMKFCFRGLKDNLAQSSHDLVQKSHKDTSYKINKSVFEPS